MRRTMLRTTLILAFTVGTVIAVQELSFGAVGESYGFAGEDFFGGGSYLGVDTRDVTADRLGPLKLKEERGVEVTTVDQDAPAGKAGLKEHDVILNLNGTEVEGVEQLRRMIHEIPPGRVVTLGISRDGQPMTVKAQLADRKKAFALAGPDAKAFKFEIPAIPPMDMDVPVSIVVVHSSVRSGLLVENLTPQLGEFFGARNGQGVLVRSVDKGSRAEKAGFHAGDVIVRINGEPVHDAGDFTHALRGRKDNTVNVGIIRDKKEQTLTLTLPERKQSELFDESFEWPDIDLDAETHIDLSELRSQMASIRPQIALAVEQARQAGEEVKKSLRQHCEEVRKQREEIRKQQRELQKEMLEKRQELRHELQMELPEDKI